MTNNIPRSEKSPFKVETEDDKRDTTRRKRAHKMSTNVNSKFTFIRNVGSTQKATSTGFVRATRSNSGNVQSIYRNRNSSVFGSNAKTFGTNYVNSGTTVNYNVGTSSYNNATNAMGWLNFGLSALSSLGNLGVGIAKTVMDAKAINGNSPTNDLGDVKVSELPDATNLISQMEGAKDAVSLNSAISSATGELQYLEGQQTSNKARIDVAQKTIDNAKTTQTENQSALDNAKSAKSDASVKKSEAQKGLSEAQQKYGEAKANQEIASSKLQDATTAQETADIEYTDAQKATKDAQNNYNSKHEAATNARTAANNAKSTLSSTPRTIPDGNGGFKTNPEYTKAYDAWVKAEQNAQKAETEERLAKDQLDKAKEDEQKAKTALEDANTALEQAKTALNDANTALEQANEGMKGATDAEKTAADNYATACKNYTQADEAVTTAEKNITDFETQLKEAKSIVAENGKNQKQIENLKKEIDKQKTRAGNLFTSENEADVTKANKIKQDLNTAETNYKNAKTQKQKDKYATEIAELTTEYNKYYNAGG